ncbi:hypothetical protein SAMD00023353_1502160 [Rosellinia necatrix]|uniref:Uncharacterized protein n=1 Tax=Rosellinia necatrix TaxID=77044 RepID=A0A1S8A783_ROSNE|nr:hypothetical protein SAMD00023353_1502160 [Rosellinia necatrix]
MQPDDILPYFIILLPHTIPIALSLPHPHPQQQHHHQQPRLAKVCSFYGFVDAAGLSNAYTVDMTSRDLGGVASSGDCGQAVLSDYVQTQCDARLDGFSCTRAPSSVRRQGDSGSDSDGGDGGDDGGGGDSMHITFRIHRAADTQPNCVSEALRLARRDAQPVECSCLAECWGGAAAAAAAAAGMPGGEGGRAGAVPEGSARGADG